MNNEIKALVSKVTPVKRVEQNQEDTLVKTAYNDSNSYDVTVLFYVEDKMNGDYGFERKYSGYYDANQNLHFINPVTGEEVLPLNVGTYVNIACDENGKILSIVPTDEEPPLVMGSKFHRL